MAVRSKKMWQQGGNQGGFMLLEPLVALAAAALLLGVVASYHGAIARRAYDTRMRLEAVSQATDALEGIVYGHQTSEPLGMRGITLTYSYEQFERMQGSAELDQSVHTTLRTILVTATWSSASGMQASVTLTDSVPKEHV